MSKMQGERPAVATVRELYDIRLPAPIGKSLMAVSAKETHRAILHRTFCASSEAGKTVLVATDTHTMMIATAPANLEIPDGAYQHEVAPAVVDGMGKMLVAKMDQNYPNWNKVLPPVGSLKQIGTFNNQPNTILSSAATYGRLELSGSICIDYRKLAVLCPTVYTVSRRDDEGVAHAIHTFDGCLDGWTLRYIVMGMVESGWEMEASKP